MRTTSKISILILSLSFGFGIFLAFFRLTESPPLWLDEGIITQVAINSAKHLEYGLQVAPEKFVSGAFITTGYPVTYPISVAMDFFGVGLLEARIVMSLFIIICLIFGYLLIEKSFGKPWSYFSLLLLVSFAPLYGHGKSVLGEVPGISFLLLTLFFLAISKGRRQYYILSGLCAGLCITTKPIFILLLPSVFFGYLLHRRELKFQTQNILFSVVASLIPISIWLFLQFSEDSFPTVFGHYANPYGIPFSETFFPNLKQFFTEFQPLYFLSALLLWIVSYAVRKKRGMEISMSESIAFLFSFFVFLNYFRIEGHYRYFFLGQVITLLYLPNALRVWQVKPKYPVLSGLIAFQLYATFFQSWVSNYYESHRSENLRVAVQSIPKDDKVFVYQVPQTVVFLEDRVYYQYVKITDRIILGEEQKNVLLQGAVSSVIIPKEQYESLKETLFSKYEIARSFDSLLILSRKKI